MGRVPLSFLEALLPPFFLLLRLLPPFRRGPSDLLALSSLLDMVFTGCSDHRMVAAALPRHDEWFRRFGCRTTHLDGAARRKDSLKLWLFFFLPPFDLFVVACDTGGAPIANRTLRVGGLHAC